MTTMLPAEFADLEPFAADWIADYESTQMEAVR